jgi:hypothetical protein
MTTTSPIRRLVRRLAILAVPAVTAVGLLAPAPAHAVSFRRFHRFNTFCSSFFSPVFTIPTSTGTIVVSRNNCGFERRSFEPFFDDGFGFDGFNGFSRPTTSNSVVFFGSPFNF